MLFRSCLLLAATVGAAASAEDGRDYVAVVLLGSTGNLAKKYLWQSLLNAGEDAAFDVVVLPAATKKAAIGQPLVAAALIENVTYAGAASRAAFDARILPYHQLRSDGDYSTAAATLAEYARSRAGREIGRLWYLAVPPKFYGGIAKNIHAQGRPPSSAAAPSWMRVVFEKPFGSSFDSAKALAATLADSGLDEPEIYRVDHYLGKAAVRALLPFRAANKLAFEIEGATNAARLPASWGHTDAEGRATALTLERVEVAMKETEDCEGRTSFYDSYGVVRDVLQNHLTEIAAASLMELPALEASLGKIKAAKANFMEALRWESGPGSASAFSGAFVAQYAGYRAHVATDEWTKGDASTTTPTFAAVSLASTRSGWTRAAADDFSAIVDVPIFLLGEFIYRYSLCESC